MGRKKKQKHDEEEELEQPSLSTGIISVVLVIAAILVTLSFFNAAGSAGVMLNEFLLSFLFGNIRFAVPLILLAFAWYVIRDVQYDYRKTHFIGAALFFVSLSSLMHLGFDVDAMWPEALNGNGGGVFGMLAWVLKTYLGSIASWVILVGLVLVSFLLIFNTSVAGFVMLHRKLFTSIGSVGSTIVRAVTFLFVPKSKQDEYDKYDDEDEYDDDEEEPKRKRRFFRRRGLEEDEEYEDEEEEEEYDEEDEVDAEEEIQVRVHQPEEEPNDDDPHSDVWTKRVIIRKLPTTKLLTSKKGKPTSGDIKSNAQTIKDTLAEFRIDVDMGDVRIGPTVTQYTFKPAKGVKVSRITSLSNDLALALAAHPIRIEAPIPGKSLVGVEVPNQKTAMVTFKELIESKAFVSRKHDMMMALGKDVGGKVWFADLPRMPHLLIAGATGSGKTVCMNTIIMSMLFQNTAADLRMIMVDPKRVELTPYNGIPHLLTPVITNTQKTVNALRWCIGEMDRRFEIMSKSHSRNIDSYNEKYPKNKMPRIVFVIDELADLMATAASDIEAGIIRLAQMARAVGIHLIVATQRPSVDVITGLMKANIPARIAFSVASLTDSRTILDSPGAEKLLGRGDMLFQTAELSKPVRIQGAFISESEMKTVVEHLKGDEEPEYDESIVSKDGGNGTMSMFGGPSDDRDPLFMQAQNLVIEAKKASASFLQRRLKVGYARAARILDELEEAGIVGPSNGSKPREILASAAAAAATMGAGGDKTVFKPKSQPEPEPEEEDELEEDDETFDDEVEDEPYLRDSEDDENEDDEEDSEDDEYDEEEEYEDEDDDGDYDNEDDEEDDDGYIDEEEEEKNR